MNETLEQARARFALQEARDRPWSEQNGPQSQGGFSMERAQTSRKNKDMLTSMTGDESEQALPDQNPQDQRLDQRLEENDDSFSMTARAEAASKKAEGTKNSKDHDAAFRAHHEAMLAHGAAERQAHEGGDRLLARKHRQQAQAHDDAMEDHMESMLDDPNFVDDGEEKKEVDEAWGQAPNRSRPSAKIVGPSQFTPTGPQDDFDQPTTAAAAGLPHINKYDQGPKQTGANNQYDAVKKKFTDGLIEEAAKEGEAECEGADDGKPPMTPADMGMLKGKKLKEFADNLQSASSPTTTTFSEAKSSFAEGMKSLCKKGK